MRSRPCPARQQGANRAVRSRWPLQLARPTLRPVLVAVVAACIWAVPRGAFTGPSRLLSFGQGLRGARGAPASLASSLEAASKKRRLCLVRASEGGQAAAEVDVAIVGSGPAGTLLAKLLAERHNRKVCMIDARASQPWTNNYGVWQAEWDALEAKLQVGLDKCLSVQWGVTDCYFGGSWDMPTEQRMRLDVPYARVDRAKLKAQLQSPTVQVFQEALDAKVIAPNLYVGPGLEHDAAGSTLRLPSGQTIRTKLVVDCSGAESQLTRRVQPPGEPPSPDPGYQIAYGFSCIVEGNTHYAIEAMTLFDYRTDHLSFDPAWEKDAQDNPTFIYAMPLSPVPGEPNSYKVFFEETSLVARPALSCEECRKRCFRRLKHLGVTVRPGTIDDEEFCYIPMGGPLPEPGQRVAAFGGAAAMVHPSTGYQLCRMMAAAKEVSDAIGAGFESGSSPDAIAAASYEAIWSPEKQAQRGFAVFGGEFLMGLNVEGLRGWFTGFFQLPQPLWAGFLAGWPTLPGNDLHESWFSRLWFGLQLVIKLPFPIVLKLVGGIAVFSLTYGTTLLRSVTPLFGAPPAYTYTPPVPSNQIGDVPAKIIIEDMIKKGTPQKAE